MASRSRIRSESQTLLSYQHSSSRTRSDRALATLIPHTTSPRGSRFEVVIEAKFLRAGAFDVQNIITIPHAKLLRKLEDLTPEQLAEIEEVLLFWLGFEEENP